MKYVSSVPIFLNEMEFCSLSFLCHRTQVLYLFCGWKFLKFEKSKKKNLFGERLDAEQSSANQVTHFFVLLQFNNRKKEDTLTEWQKTERERKKERDKKENEKEKEGTKRSKRDRERERCKKSNNNQRQKEFI